MSTAYRYSLIASIFVMLILTTGTMVFAIPIADSETEFSNLQGQDNWFYGYYDGDSSNPFTNDPLNDDFEQLTNFSGGSWGLTPGSGGFWTFLWASGGHPNGPISSGGRQPVEQWASRRWISEVSGDVNISGILAKKNPGGGDGITGRIFIDGLEMFSQSILYNDTVGLNYSIDVTVGVGSLIDFVIDPGLTDGFDGTSFTATIETSPVPEPSTILLFSFGLIGIAYKRKMRMIQE